MVRHAAAHRHLHRQKHKKRQPFDYLIYFFTVATPLFEVPQAISIYGNHDAEQVSAATWGFFLVASVVFTLYAIREHLKPLIVAYTLYTIVELIIVVGIILYG
jgi:uncharacterized protein with PQ loop repeat